jgi:hypothetical protein
MVGAEVPVTLLLTEPDSVTLRDIDAVTLLDNVALWLGGSDAVTVAEDEYVGVPDGVGDIDEETELVALRERVDVPDRLGSADIVADGVTDGVFTTLRDADTGMGASDELGVPVALGGAAGVTLGDGARQSATS